MQEDILFYEKKFYFDETIKYRSIAIEKLKN